MAVRIYEESVDLRIGLLEADPIAKNSAYPYPFLNVTDREETRTFRGVYLENEFLKVCVLPDLGGRIISVWDKRTKTELLKTRSVLWPVRDDHRGASLPDGIVLKLNGSHRLTSLGSVALDWAEPEPEDSVGTIWLSDTWSSPGFRWHLRISLPSDRAAIEFEVRVSNPGSKPLNYNGGLAIFTDGGKVEEKTFTAEHQCFLVEDPHGLIVHESGNEGFQIMRFTQPRPIAPHQVDTWTLTLTPYSGLTSHVKASPNLAASLSEAEITVQSSVHLAGHKFLILTADGQTLEAPAEIYPEHLVRIESAKLPSPPIGFAVLNPSKEEILCIDLRTLEPTQVKPRLQPEPERHEWLSPDLGHAELVDATFDVRQRHLAYAYLSFRELGLQEWEKADAFLEQALLYNGDAPNLWWAKALAQRRRTEESENAELLNAHYLAPLDPALRAEAFLAQPLSIGKDPSPLLDALDDTPEAFVDVACRLIEVGQLDDANRWLDEALRRHDLAMLRYLMAYCLLVGTRMDADAADHVAAAAKVAGPPYPWREVERNAIHFLAERFSSDSNLSALHKLLTP